MTATTDNSLEIEITSEIVAAYVSNNPIATNHLPVLINDVYQLVRELAGKQGGVAHRNENPAVPIKRSVKEDYIVCLEDGKKFKTLKRHLRSHYNMSPEEYREKWGLPGDYPMVAPNYAKKRSELARQSGLGRKPGS